jgi:hypothetical protein
MKVVLPWMRRGQGHRLKKEQGHYRWGRQIFNQVRIPEIDREKTKEAVEAALEKYRFYLLTVPEERLRHIHLFLLLTSMLFIHLQKQQ